MASQPYHLQTARSSTPLVADTTLHAWVGRHLGSDGLPGGCTPGAAPHVVAAP